MIKEEIARGRFKLALEIHDFAVKHPDCYMPREWDELSRAVQVNYLKSVEEEFNLIKSNLPDMSEEEIADKLGLRLERYADHSIAAWARYLLTISELKRLLKAYQSKLKEMLGE